MEILKCLIKVVEREERMLGRGRIKNYRKMV